MKVTVAGPREPVIQISLAKPGEAYARNNAPNRNLTLTEAKEFRDELESAIKDAECKWYEMHREMQP